MPNPIPVFSFVFAAYAATSISAEAPARTPSIHPLLPSDSFATAWRARAASGAALFAKVGVLPSASGQEIRLAVRGSSEACFGLWLEKMLETRLGLVGVVMEGQPLPCAIKTGQRIRLHQINLLGWKLADRITPYASSGTPYERRNPHEMLASLIEIVRS